MEGGGLMLKLMPTIAVLTRKDEKKGGDVSYLKFSVAIDDVFYNCTIFRGGADFLDDYGKIGAKLFFEDWVVKKNQKGDKTYFDFIVNRVKIVKNGGDVI